MKELNSILKIKETDKRLDNIESNFIEADYKVLQGEQLIANTNDGYTKDIKISGQSVLNVAPIKGPVDIMAELSGTGTDITFEGTSEGYVDGVVIKGKTYQNLSQSLVIITYPENDMIYHISTETHMLTPGKTYTFITRKAIGETILEFRKGPLDYILQTISSDVDGGKVVATIPIGTYVGWFRFYKPYYVDLFTREGARGCLNNIMILEGDHTANTDINEYFEDIAGVGDKGKNLFDKNDVIMDSRVSEVSGSILSGFPDTIVSGISKVKPSTNYVIDGRGSYSGVYAYGKNMEYIKDISSSSTFTAPDNAYFVRFHIQSSQDLNRVQLEEGTASTPYEEYYDGVNVEVKSCGKNLFKGDWVNGAYDRVTGAEIVRSTQVRSEYQIPIDSSKTYQISNDGLSRNTNVFEYDKNNRFLRFVESLNSGVYTPDRDVSFINLLGNPDKRDKFQLEEGTDITPYEPYKEHKVKTILQSPLMSLPNGVCDKIVGNTLIRRIGKVVLDGSESDWAIWENFGAPNFQDIDTTTFIYSLKSPSEATDISVPGFKQRGICNRFVIDNPYNTHPESITAHLERIRLRINKSKLGGIMNEQGLKAWLAANPTTVYYELATPKITPIIDNKECVVLPNGIVNRWSEDKLVRNVGKVILDGSEEWELNTTPNQVNTLSFLFKAYDNPKFEGTDAIKGGLGNHIKLDGFNTMASGPNFNSNDSEMSGLIGARPTIGLRILKSKLATPDVEGFKKWLSENNTTVWYELETPEVTNIRKEQFKLKTYNTRTSISTNTVIPPELNINSVGLRKTALIKPETKYQFKFKRASGTNPITVDLGGAKKVLTNESTVMITTPATLSHDELRISGYNVKVENVMTTEGESSCDYADGIASVGDKGKNLFDVNKWYYWTNRINPNPSISSIDNGISIDFRNTSGAFASLKNLKAGVYVLSANIDCGSQLVVRFRDCIVNDNLPIDDINSTIYEARLSNGKNSIIITLNRHCESITFQRANHTTGICKMTYFQLEEGTIATPYEEYYDGYRAKTESCGKNLFDIDNLYVSRMSNSVILPEYDYNASIIGKTDIGFSIKSKYNNGESWYGGSCDLKSFKTGQLYTMNADASTEGKHYYLNVCTYTDKNIVDRTTCNYKVSVVNAKSIDFVIPHNSVKVILSCVSQFFKANQILKVNRIQVEEGTKSPYTPHTSDTLKLRLPEPLRSVPSGVSDTIEKTNGEWVVARRCDEVILDESKDWKYHSSKESLGLHRYILDFNKMKTSHDNSSNIYCNNLNIGIDNSEAEIWIDKTIITRKDINRAAFYIISQIGEPTKFKQWLSENPTTVIYELAQPTMHPLNTLQLPNGISDEIKNGKLIKKISKIVFDGSQEWGYSSFNTETKDFVVFYHNESMGYNGCINSIKEGYLCNSFESETPEFTSIGDLFATKECISGDTTKKELRLSIQKSKLLTADISGLNKWLLENPITVYYELDNKIELDYKSEDLNLKTYKDTTHFYSNTNVNPDLAIKLLENDNLSTSVKNLYDYIARLEKQVSILTKNGVLFE